VNDTFSGPLFGKGARDAILKILETGGSAGSFSLKDIPSNFLNAFLDGLGVSLLAAVAFVGLAGVVALFVREPQALDDDETVDGVITPSPASPPRAAEQSMLSRPRPKPRPPGPPRR